jgi:hypothetical protein
MARTLAALLIAVFAGGVGGADDWPAATIKEVFSESREWFVRVVPGKSLGDTFGFAGSPKGPYARAEFYRRASDRSYRLTTEITLDNPIAPVRFLVTDRGYLVTFDNWHNVGYGKMIVSYAPSGRRAASYELEDLVSTREIEAFTHSTSSIHWRTETLYVRAGQRAVYVALDDKGTELIFEPETGAWQQCEWRGKQHLCRHDNARRDWRPFREVGNLD